MKFSKLQVTKAVRKWKIDTRNLLKLCLGKNFGRENEMSFRVGKARQIECEIVHKFLVPIRGSFSLTTESDLHENRKATSDFFLSNSTRFTFHKIVTVFFVSSWSKMREELRRRQIYKLFKYTFFCTFPPFFWFAVCWESFSLFFNFNDFCLTCGSIQFLNYFSFHFQRSRAPLSSLQFYGSTASPCDLWFISIGSRNDFIEQSCKIV